MFQDLWELPDKQRMSNVADAFEAAYAKESTEGSREGEHSAVDPIHTFVFVALQ